MNDLTDEQTKIIHNAYGYDSSISQSYKNGELVVEATWCEKHTNTCLGPPDEAFQELMDCAPNIPQDTIRVPESLERLDSQIKRIEQELERINAQLKWRTFRLKALQNARAIFHKPGDAG